jgi:murein DD-endopeptidase MepM/ murein hydrolase activator NlpD
MISFTIGALALGAPGAFAQGDGGIGTTSPTSPSQGGAGGGSESADATPDPGGRVELTLSNARPRKAYLLGSPAVFRYAIAGNETRDLKVEVVKKSSREVVATIAQNNVAPKSQQAVSWGGRTNSGSMAAQGEYRFRVVAGGESADESRAEGKPDAAFYANKFPVRGRHSYGDGIGAGRGHRGQDVLADCGTPLVAAHGGKVQAVGYDGSGAGNYIVIDGKQSRWDYVYMHLRKPALPREGERVKTGERIGDVGDTGNSTACHLHFELWTKPGWYEGGEFSGSVTKNLKRWDRWS